MPTTLASLSLAVFAGSAVAVNEVRYNFSEVTSLAAGALLGQNVPQPVPGFELLLLKDGVPVYHRAFGNWGVGQVAATDSATKTLSGALIVSLTADSPLPFSLDTRLSEYIPQFSGDKAAITIRQAFSHTSGLPANSLALSDAGITLQEAAVRIAGQPLQSVPGTEFLYGGASMHAAGAVAELAGGAPWNTLFRERIAAPLRLNVTRYVLTSPANPRIASGAESNAEEFARFMEMLRAGGVYEGRRLLPREAVDAMFTRQTPPGIPIDISPIGISDYGVGVWLDRRLPGGRLEGAIAAGARGFCSWIDFDDGMVGVFATDLSSATDNYALLNMIRDAAQRAVRTPFCVGDFNFDGFIDIFDFDAFVRSFEFDLPGADITADGFIDFFDYAAFVDGFENGC